MDIESFIPHYPSVDDPDFTYNISRKKEFYDLRLDRSEPVPDESGELLQSQLYMKRFFSSETPYAEALLYHGIGTGKSCTASAIVENFKAIDVAGKPRKPALVFVKSEELARNIANEIAMICTKDVYTPKATSSEIKKGMEMTEETKIARLNKAILRSYEIVSIETFLKNLPDDATIKEKYSHRTIILDESHTLRPQPSRKKKKGLMALIEEEVKGETGGEDSMMLWKLMHRFLHAVVGCRKLLLTGTPIWDKSLEIASQLNLILPEDQQLPMGNEFDDTYFDEDGILREDMIPDLKEKLKGRISYLRPMITSSKREEQGIKSPWLKYLTIFPDGMSETQAAYAKEARDIVEKKEIKVKGKTVEREVKGGTVLKIARDAMNMVLPLVDTQGKVTDVVYGPSAFEKYIVKKAKKRTKSGETTVQTYAIDNNLKNELLTNLAEYSAKFASIIEDIKAHPNELTFIYNEEVTGLGGAIMLGLLMQIHGMRWIKSTSDIVAPSEGRRFAIITSDPQTTNQPKQIYDLIKSFNKPDNRYGQRLQVIIGSEKIVLGVTLKNIRRIHTVMPHWNIPSGEQAEGRGLRFGSHDDLPEDERTISIFRHAAVEVAGKGEKGYGLGKGYPSNVSFSNVETTDTYIYGIAEEKDHRNTQIYRVMKEVAFDCASFYLRNVLPEDIDGTRACDYQECNYQCDAFPNVSPDPDTGIYDYSVTQGELDYSTYNLFYATDHIKTIIDSIIDLFNVHFVLEISKAQELLDIPDLEKPLFLQAIDTIINGRVLVRNRYGFGAYLKESGNLLFLDSNISPYANYPESIYIENPLVTDKTSFDDLVNIVDLDLDQSKVAKFCKKPSVAILDEMSYITKILLLEISYAAMIASGDESIPSIDLIIEELGDNIHEMNDGTIVHIMHTEEYKGIAYDVASKDIKVTGLMRYFDPDSGKWNYIESRDIEETYVEEIRVSTTGTKEVGFEDNPYGVFGWISKKDGSFRINVKPEAGKKGKARGKKCVNFQIVDLVDIFVNRIDYLPPPKDEYISFSKNDLIKAIKGRTGFPQFKDDLESKDKKYLGGLLTLMTSRIEDLCEYLHAWFEENDLLYNM